MGKSVVVGLRSGKKRKIWGRGRVQDKLQAQTRFAADLRISKNIPIIVHRDVFTITSKGVEVIFVI